MSKVSIKMERGVERAGMGKRADMGKRACACEEDRQESRPVWV